MSDQRFEQRPADGASAHGGAVITKVSPSSVGETVARLSAVVAARGMKVFAVIDHSGEAVAVGLDLRDTKVVLFGSPRAGTPVMVAETACGTGPAAQGADLVRRSPDEGQLHSAVRVGCPLRTRRRVGREARRHRRADRRRHRRLADTEDAASCRLPFDPADAAVAQGADPATGDSGRGGGDPDPRLLIGSPTCTWSGLEGAG